MHADRAASETDRTSRVLADARKNPFAICFRSAACIAFKETLASIEKPTHRMPQDFGFWRMRCPLPHARIALYFRNHGLSGEAGLRDLLSGLIAASAHREEPLPASGARSALERSLQAIRVHLNMDVSFISEIVGGRRYFRHVDEREKTGLIQAGSSDPVEDSYCARVIDGRLPSLMQDARLHFEAAALPATHLIPVGAHLSVPVRLSDGRIYGTLCCFSHAADETLTSRDLAVMQLFAEIVSDQIQTDIATQDARQLIEDRIQDVLVSDDPSMVYQPIFRISDHSVVGVEALSRFAPEPYRPPDVWFAEAAKVNCAIALESKAIGLALLALHQLPTHVYVAVNASPKIITAGSFADLLRGVALDRVVVEITEHFAVDQYEEIVEVIRPLQERGLRLAIDDAGAGYASFKHVLNLRPDIIKLDLSITRSIDSDRSRRALAAALCTFARETGCKIVAEGVETREELSTLRELGIGNAQGYFLERPMPLENILARWKSAR